MSSKRRKKRSQRDISNISKSSPLLRRDRIDYRSVLDRRKFYYGHYGYSKLTSGQEAEVKITTRSAKGTRYASLPYARLQYTDPRNTISCRRRSDRRKALFARGNIGRGKSTRRFRKRRMKKDSRVRC